MAVAYETSLTPSTVTFNAAGETETVAFDAGSGSNRVLIVFVCWRDRDNVITGVTYNSVAMTSASAKTEDADGFISGQLWYLAGPASGSNNIAVTMGASGGSNSPAQITATVFNGVDQTTPVDGFVDDFGSASTANVVSAPGAITSAVDDRVVSFHGTQNASENLTATPTNYTERQDAATGAGFSVEFGDAAGAASVTTSATWNNSAILVRWVALGINVNASGGGGGETITVDKWLPEYEVRQGIKAAMVPSGMTPPDRVV